MTTASETSTQPVLAPPTEFTPPPADAEAVPTNQDEIAAAAEHYDPAEPAETPAANGLLAGVSTMPAPAEDDEPEDDEPEDDEPEPWADKTEWKYDWLDFHDDRLAVRIPNKNALQGLFAAKDCTPEGQNTIASSFWLKTGKDGNKCANHISEVSFERVSSRMVDADEVDYGGFDDLMGKLTELGAKRIEADLAAQKATAS